MKLSEQIAGIANNLLAAFGENKFIRLLYKKAGEVAQLEAKNEALIQYAHEMYWDNYEQREAFHTLSDDTQRRIKALEGEQVTTGVVASDGAEK